MENVIELNDMRRIKNMEKTVKLFEKQLADIKKAHGILVPHVDFRFFSITCYALREEQKSLAAELLRLKLRLDKAKNPSKYEQLLIEQKPE
jgi:hypothetical protein